MTKDQIAYQIQDGATRMFGGLFSSPLLMILLVIFVFAVLVFPSETAKLMAGLAERLRATAASAAVKSITKALDVLGVPDASKTQIGAILAPYVPSPKSKPPVLLGAAPSASPLVQSAPAASQTAATAARPAAPATSPTASPAAAQ